MNAEAIVEIRGIAGGGDGVATLPDGRTVFVPRTAPGDRIRLRDVRLQSRMARAEVDELLESSPDRVAPPCPHYVTDRCGSCQLMHLSGPAQRAAKSRIVGDAVRRLGKLAVADPAVAAAPQDLRYRTKVTFAVHQGRIGYHPLHQPAQVFQVIDCLIADPVLMQLHAALRGERSRLPADVVRVVLRLDREGGRHIIVATSAGDVWTGASALHRALCARGMEAIIWWQPPLGQARALAGAADPWPATVFEQVHPAVGDQVRRAGIDALGAVDGRAVWDLYAGIGETTRALAERGARVDSVESDPRAVALAEARGPAGPVRHVGTVERQIASLPAPDAVITNPPRVGMTAAVGGALIDAGPRRIVYVSCDPATLARDLARLNARYAVASIAAFDQFPQTAHVETVAVLDRR